MYELKFGTRNNKGTNLCMYLLLFFRENIMKLFAKIISIFIHFNRQSIFGINACILKKLLPSKLTFLYYNTFALFLLVEFSVKGIIRTEVRENDGNGSDTPISFFGHAHAVRRDILDGKKVGR